MDDLVAKLNKSYPKISFKAAKSFYWSPATNEVFYKSGAKGQLAEWSLLHEVGHATLAHHSYDADFTLLKLELAAWQKAQEISQLYGIEIDNDHIQDCLDTYRDWLHKRSICPKCSTQAFQQNDHLHYRCHNCHAEWYVTTSLFCRTYRKNEPQQSAQQIFA